MNINQLSKDSYILEWFSNIEAAKNTQRNFLRGMELYTEFVKKTPAELIEEAEQEILSGTLMRKRKIREHLITFREWLKSQEYAPKTINGHLIAPRSFYKSYDIDIPSINFKKQFKAVATEENSIRLEKEQIQEMLKYANVRNKAIILTLASSGLAQSDLLELKISDFKKGYDDKTGITTLQLRRIKTKVNFITFLSSEASIAVLDYINYRNRKPKEEYASNKDMTDAYEKRRIKSDQDYLFCKHDVPDMYLKTLSEKDRKLNASGLMDMFRETAKKAGLDTNKGQWQICRAHNLRKFFDSALLNNGADSFFVEYLMGHTISESKAAYFKGDPAKLKERYMRYMPFLTLTSLETRVLESDEYKQLKDENTELKRRFDELKSKADKTEKLEAEMDNMKAMLNSDVIKSMIEARVKELMKKEQ